MDLDGVVRSINAAMENANPWLSVVASVSEDSLHVITTQRAASGAVVSIKEQSLPELTFASLRHSPERCDAFFLASSLWLRSQDENVGELVPEDLFVVSLLDDLQLQTDVEFTQILLDPRRRELAIARSELAEFLEKPEIVGIDLGEEELVALFLLTPSGRAMAGLARAVESVTFLAASGDASRTALVAMMNELADEDYEPWETAWEDGPRVSTLLLEGAWHALEGRVDGALRARALRAFDRVARPLPLASLQRAGFVFAPDR